MEILTNVVVAALLTQASAFVREARIPIQPPLDPQKVESFRWRIAWGREGEELSCYFSYQGGYEFRHSKGRIDSFDTQNAYSNVQDPNNLERLLGDPKFSQTQCLEEARDVIRRLGYTDVGLINTEPVVEVPTYVGADGRRIPRYIFHWLKTGSTKIRDASVEVNSSDLNIEYISLPAPAFWREPWPLTFGMTNSANASHTKMPNGPELVVRDVSHDYALAFIRAILPEVGAFCSKLGLPIPETLNVTDLDMGGSYVAKKQGRLTASLRLKNGFLVVYHAGHVWAVHADDALYTSPNSNPNVRRSTEWRAPTRFSKEEASEKVKQILVERLSLPEQVLFLNTQPHFSVIPDPEATNGVRRFVFHWQKPQKPEEIAKPGSHDVLPEISVSAEVDAVSGNIKAMNFLDTFFERPDPRVEIPKTSAGH